MKLGGRDYLIQRNWVNAAGGYCGLSCWSSVSSPYGVAPNAPLGAMLRSMTNVVLEGRSV